VSLHKRAGFCYNGFAMINKENTLKTAQALVRPYNLPLKLVGVEEGTEEVTLYFTSKKSVQLRELAQELELQLNLPIKLERVKKTETGKLGGVDILGKYPCCAPFLKKCPFGGKMGCGYNFASSKHEEEKPRKEEKSQKPLEPQKKAKKKKRMVRRLVLKGRN